MMWKMREKSYCVKKIKRGSFENGKAGRPARPSRMGF
jgi:hypothetical protein